MVLFSYEPSATAPPADSVRMGRSSSARTTVCKGCKSSIITASIRFTPSLITRTYYHTMCVPVGNVRDVVKAGFNAEWGDDLSENSDCFGELIPGDQLEVRKVFADILKTGKQDLGRVKDLKPGTKQTPAAKKKKRKSTPGTHKKKVSHSYFAQPSVPFLVMSASSREGPYDAAYFSVQDDTFIAIDASEIIFSPETVLAKDVPMLSLAVVLENQRGLVDLINDPGRTCDMSADTVATMLEAQRMAMV